MKQFIFNFFTKGHERTIKAKKNILGLLFVKGYSIAINLALIPITLKLLDDYKYGVWITIFNVLSWISIFDIGIGNGLRNKFTEAIAKNQIDKAREYVSTAYFLMIAISIGLILIFIIPWFIIDWSSVFNVEKALNHELFLLIGIAFLMTSLQFSLKLINTILTADHKPNVAALISTISNTLILIVFLFGSNFLKGSLVGIGFVYTALPLLVFVISSLYYFNGRYKNVTPKLIYFRRNRVKELFSLGIQFFVIQIAVIVIFTSDSLIISHVSSPKDVTIYNIVLKYFSVVTMLAGLVMSPLWSAYTEAATKNDVKWIKLVIHKQLKFFLILIIGVLILAISANKIIPLWLQTKIDLNWTLIIGMSLFTILSVWNNIFSTLLGGLSFIRLGSIVTVFTCLVNIPLSIYFFELLDKDIAGVIFATSICIGVTAIISPIQIYYFLYFENKTDFLNKLLK